MTVACGFGPCPSDAALLPDGSLLTVTSLTTGEDRPACADHGVLVGEMRVLLGRILSYRDYLQSEWWQERRLLALELAGWKCQDCGGTEDLEVHHLTYERLGAELDADLRALCHHCHSHTHGREP